MIRRLIIKLTHWEYWPFWLLYLPVFLYYGWLAIKHRSFFFFTASNPSIKFGGMFGERKSDIFKLIPQEYYPNTAQVTKGDIERAAFSAERIGFPLIAKPDIGERGMWVEKINDQKKLQEYVESCPVDFLLQEMVSYPIELGVFYVKKQGHEGKVTSIVRKEFLQVEGDGKQTIWELVNEIDRAQLTANLNSDFLRKNGDQIPGEGEKILIEPIGNHCRGTKFLNDNDQIDDGLNDAFNSLADQIPDFYFGRFDLRCKSYEDLKGLKNFKILELNGAGAEPGHIYQPGYPLWKAYRDIFWHLAVLSDISAQNRKKGHSYWSFRQGFSMWKSHRRYNRLLTNS
ncbi:hypothetical protein [Ekhidna sp.]|uniref:hypothetical protein n=1 Tax=Ekhidna sp. TaxID=2608089 RepID=UPI0032EE09F1